MSDGHDDEAPVLPPGTDARRRLVRGVRGADGRDVHLAVAELGDPDRPAIVLAHGVGSSARFVVAAFADPLLAAGWRLITYDARGHGSSSPALRRADHHLDVYAADLGAVVDRSRDVAVVGGISLGGHAALRWGGALPRVVCLPAWCGRAMTGEGPHAMVAAEVRQAGIAGVVERLRADTTMPAWLRATLVTDYGRHDPDSLAAALVALDGADAPDDTEVAALPAPVAVVAWRDDPGHPFAVAERLAATARRGTLTALAIDDLETKLTRFGEVVLKGLGSIGVTAATTGTTGRRS